MYLINVSLFTIFPNFIESEEDVCRFDIEMDDILRMKDDETLHHLLSHLEKFPDSREFVF